MVNGLMVVAIVQYDITWCKQCAADNVVRAGSTIQYEECSICIVYFSGKNFCVISYAIVQKKIAHIQSCAMSKVTAEYIFTHEVYKLSASWGSSEEVTTMMAWAGVFKCTIFYMLNHSLEERWCYFIIKSNYRFFNAAVIKSLRDFARISIDNMVYLTKNFFRKFFMFSINEENRSFKACVVDFINIFQFLVSDYCGTNVSKISIIQTNFLTNTDGVKIRFC